MHTDNVPRTRIGYSGVESWFLRANHPSEPRALWLKATTLIPRSAPPVAEVWCALFDGNTRQTWASKQTVPLEQASLIGDAADIQIAGCSFHMGMGTGSAAGQLEDGHATWDLQWSSPDIPLAAPLCVPPRRLIGAPFPKNKLLTPAPAIALTGRLTLGGDTWNLDGWWGSQGHNWGASHAPAYAWAQVVFPGADGAPAVVAEGFSGRIALGCIFGPVLSPWLSALVVRRGAQEFRFDRLVDRWRHRVHRGDLSWSLKIRGRAGHATLALDAEPELTACLGYRNPDGTLATCLNSKLARAILRVQPKNDAPFEVQTAHGAALEFLQREPDPRFPDPV